MHSEITLLKLLPHFSGANELIRNLRKKTYPEMSIAVDIYGSFHEMIRTIQNLLSRHNASIVDENVNVSNLLLHLPPEEHVCFVKCPPEKVQTTKK